MYLSQHLIKIFLIYIHGSDPYNDVNYFINIPTLTIVRTAAFFQLNAQFKIVCSINLLLE